MLKLTSALIVSLSLFVVPVSFHLNQFNTTLYVQAQGSGSNSGNNGGSGSNTGNNGGSGSAPDERKEKICKSIKDQSGGIEKELEGSIVPCGRAVHQCDDDKENDICGFPHIFILVNNLTSRFISTVFAPLVVIILMYIGFLFIKEQAAAKAKAKQLLWRLLVGTFFVLAAWLIVNLIVRTFVKDETVKGYIGYVIEESQQYNVIY